MRRRTRNADAQAGGADARHNMESGAAKPQHPHYEFGGPFGALMTMFSLPLVILFLHHAATKVYKFNFTNVSELSKQFPTHFTSYFSFQAFILYLAWFALNVVLERTIFAERIKGVTLPNNTQLTYNISGHLQFWFILFFALCAKPVLVSTKQSFSLTNLPQISHFTHFDLTFLYDNYIQFAMSAVVFACLFSVFLYLKSFATGALLAKGGNTGTTIYDFFIGRELNPRIGSLDLKEFCELRPGLILWVLLNMGCAMKQQQLFGYISYEMILINIFQGVYVWDGLYNEKSILTTMDITTDGFGWMLCFGDLAWVPFSYSLQARYLTENPQNFSAPYLVLISCVNLLGYSIFRGANSEKDAFRTDPDGDRVKHLKYITTQSGRKLLVSGWWGKARKINYTGDLLLGLSWCLTTGFDTPVTYFYVIYFAVLLIHRAWRDDTACAEKYGADWEKYKKAVPYIFIPGLI